MIPNLSRSGSVLFVFLLFLVSSCAPSSPPVTAVMPATITQTAPTHTSIPTDTPSPTKTLIPPTPTVAAPAKLLEYLTNVEVVHVDTFDKALSKLDWHYDAEEVRNGSVEMVGPGADKWTSISPRRPFEEGNGITVDFTYTRGAVFEFYLSHGYSFDSANYKAYAIYFGNGAMWTNVWAGNNSMGGETIPGNFGLRPDTNYTLLIAVMPDGEFLMLVWQPSDPTKTIYYHEKISKNWAGLRWDLGFAVSKGNLLLDNYQEIKFGGAK